MENDLKNLGIGEMLISAHPEVITTILGSCVSVCLFSPVSKQGGIIHYALPDKSHAKSSNRSDLNFGDLAIDSLVDSLLKLPGIKLPQLQAKIVGGASVVNELFHSNSIGELNVAMAREKLHQYGIPVVGESVGGEQGRKLYFYTSTGRLRVSMVNKSQLPFLGKRVLIVDDSKTMREILKQVITSPQLEVVGMAQSAEEAAFLIESLKPDLITLDINMPRLNGVEFLRRYLPKYPIPTVMISSLNINESRQVIEALEIGAVDYIQKPSLDEIKTQSEFIRETLLTAASIDVAKKENLKRNKSRSSARVSASHDKLIAIGASTGGTEAIKEVLLRMPAKIPPIVIVQHIPPIFSTAFSKRLNELCPFEVKEGEDGDLVIPGRVIIAPGGQQMQVIEQNGELRVRVYHGEKVNRHIPSVDVLFDSVAQLVKEKAIGVILTGMGRDGARGLLNMRKSGAYTIGQDEDSSVVYGMSKAAADIGAVIKTTSLDQVVESIFEVI